MKPSKYKILLIDVDGTLVDSKGDALPSKRVIDSVKEAQKRLHVAIATGRPKKQSQPVIDALCLKGLSILNGGSEIVNLTSGEIIQRKLLPINTLKELVDIALPFGYNIYTDSDQYGKTITKPGDINNKAAKLFIEAVKNIDALHLLEALDATKGAAAHPTTSWSKGNVVDIHITHEHATKRYGVERLLKLLDIKKNEAIAIGDGHNDIPLLEAAGLKVAMGNSPNEVKSLADYVTASLDKDGVADAIEKYIL